MNKVTSIIIIIIFCFLNTQPAFSTNADSSADNNRKTERVYNRKFRKNYKKYKSFSSEKKHRIQKLHKSVKGLTPEQKRKLRERILNKKTNN